MHKSLAATLFAATLALGACGSTDLERGVTGAAIGAVGASALGGDPVVGGLVGAGAGVVCDDVNVCPR
jgi:osmotically inducible lipoprotein OsmB